MPATPDTSPANVARVLREAGARVEFFSQELSARCDALADALEREAESATPWDSLVDRIPWETRVACATLAIRDATGWTEGERAAKVLFAAFPELAPSDD